MGGVLAGLGGANMADIAGSMMVGKEVQNYSSAEDWRILTHSSEGPGRSGRCNVDCCRNHF